MPKKSKPEGGGEDLCKKKELPVGHVSTSPTFWTPRGLGFPTKKELSQVPDFSSFNQRDGFLRFLSRANLSPVATLHELSDEEGYVVSRSDDGHLKVHDEAGGNIQLSVNAFAAMMNEIVSGEQAESTQDSEKTLLKEQVDTLKAVLNQLKFSLKQKESYTQQLGQQLIASQKMEAIGALAGEMVHEFNNQLFLIGSGISKAERKSDFSDLKKYLGVATHVVAQILKYLKGEQKEPVVFEVENFLSDIHLTLSALSKPSKIDFDFDNCTDIRIEAIPSEVLQVLINLCKNAKEAISAHEGGFIKLVASKVKIETTNSYSLKEGSYLKISVQDNGPGISNEIVDKIFEPLFTTKKGVSNGGSGQGLKISKDIIQSFKGDVFVDSIPGQGSTFKVLIPVYQRKKMQFS